MYQGWTQGGMGEGVFNLSEIQAKYEYWQIENFSSNFKITYLWDKN